MKNVERRELRQEIRLVLRNLDSRWKKAASHQVCLNLERLVEHDLGGQISHILAWLPHFEGEVDLRDFIHGQLERRRIYLPRALPDGSLQFVAIRKDWSERLVAGGFGIPEPEDDGLAEHYDLTWAPFTVALLPALAFDQRGNRLGRGKGYYDRYFASPLLQVASRVGICWQLQVLKDVPIADHDVPVDFVCHEHYGFCTEFGEQRKQASSEI